MNKALVIGVALACAASVVSGVMVAQQFSEVPASITNANTFTPPTGRAANPPRESAGERRINIATSTDGITYTPTGDVLTDQGNVPDAVVADDGTIFVYYIGQGVSNHEEDTVVAVSEDQGKTWSYHFLTFLDLPNVKPPSDPDVVLLPDGTFRMFYTCDFGPNALGIRYADSTDGFTFTHKGIALRPSINVVDSTTFLIDETWTMLVLDATDAKQYVATSTDGATFTLIGDATLQAPDQNMYFLSNPIPENTPTTLLGFSNPSVNRLRTFSTSDGITWTGSDTVSMSGTQTALHGGSYLQDLSIAKISDDAYLLFYVTDIPKE
jgi:hypothetical protein